MFLKFFHEDTLIELKLEMKLLISFHISLHACYFLLLWTIFFQFIRILSQVQRNGVLITVPEQVVKFIITIVMLSVLELLIWLL